MKEVKIKGVDDTDHDILRILSDDSRINKTTIGGTLNKSPNTVKKRIEDLENKGIIKGYTVNIDYEKLGYDIIALIELTIAKGKMLEVEEDIAQYPSVFAVYDVTGTYDATVLARFKTRGELSEMVKKINSHENVIRTNTHLILNIVKESNSFSELTDYEKIKE